MTTAGTFAISLGIMTMIAVEEAALHGQAASHASQPASITVGLVMERPSIAAGQKPAVVITIKNISKQKLGISAASNLFRVHVAGKDHDPPETEWQRHRHGDWRPGDGPDLVDGPVVTWELDPDSTFSRRFDLGMFYDLSKPGEYSVYLEIYDPSGPLDESGTWLRTETVQFEIAAKTEIH